MYEYSVTHSHTYVIEVLVGEVEYAQRVLLHSGQVAIDILNVDFIAVCLSRQVMTEKLVNTALPLDPNTDADVRIHTLLTIELLVGSEQAKTCGASFRC